MAHADEVVVEPIVGEKRDDGRFRHPGILSRGPAAREIAKPTAASNLRRVQPWRNHVNEHAPERDWA